jgi:heparin binding hemagglutinin HbhA
MTLPKTDDVRKAREQAVTALGTAADQVRTPLLAALGAGDLATKAVVEFVNKAKERATERTGAVKGAVDDLPSDLTSLREKLDPAELRKLVDEYTEAALKLYRRLASDGESTLSKLREQPQVKSALDQLEKAIATAQERAEGVAGDARELAEDVLAKVTRKTRSTGEKAARNAEKLADEVAEAVREAGDDVAHEVRSTSRKAANKTAPKRTTTTTARKTTTASKTTK